MIRIKRADTPESPIIEYPRLIESAVTTDLFIDFDTWRIVGLRDEVEDLLPAMSEAEREQVVRADRQFRAGVAHDLKLIREHALDEPRLGYAKAVLVDLHEMVVEHGSSAWWYAQFDSFEVRALLGK